MAGLALKEKDFILVVCYLRNMQMLMSSFLVWNKTFFSETLHFNIHR